MSFGIFGFTIKLLRIIYDHDSQPPRFLGRIELARPRVFVSSTFYDLKHIRASLEVFIESLGFDAILFEKGDISFHPDVPLDESCYREAENADIFVLIIGGRYGSSASNGTAKKKAVDSNLYESITKKEFETAQINDVPTFILLDSAVSAEYQTYQRNRGNNSVVYAHVDSEGVFRLLDSVFEKSRNNPVFNFDRATQIESWLREQWAGLFRELLRARSQQKQLSALNSQVTELKSVNDTLKTYLEAVLSTVKPDQSEQIIKDQDNKLTQMRMEIKLESNHFYKYLRDKVKLSDDETKLVISSPSSADEAVDAVDSAMESKNYEDNSKNPLRKYRDAQSDYNRARIILDIDPIDFVDCSDANVVSKALSRSRVQDVSENKDSQLDIEEEIKENLPVKRRRRRRNLKEGEDVPS